MGSSSDAIDASNIGFQLLKKCGWKEGTGLGAAEQGPLEPLQPQVKTNKRGLGSEKIVKRTNKPQEDPGSQNDNSDHFQSAKKAKAMSKKMRKIEEQERQMQEKEFERAFFREFWPDNV